MGGRDSRSAGAGERLARLRDEMRRHDVGLYLVPSSDDHGSEYVPEFWARRRFVSDFSGSAGDALIGLDGAWLWTDSRYWLQAEGEIDGDVFTLMRQGAPDTPTLEAWLRDHADGRVVGVDPRVVSLEAARKLDKAAAEAGASLRAVDANLVDPVWEARPARPASSAVVLDECHAGRSAADKLSDLRAALARRGCGAHVLSATDAVVWLFNLRGSDVAYNPILLAYALVEADAARLFIAAEQVDEGVRAHLADFGATVEPYEALGPALRGLSGRVWIDPAAASLWISNEIAASEAEPLEAESPVAKMKALKNDVELAGMRAAHVRDGVALVRFLHWLDASRPAGLDELSASQRLDALRAEGEKFRGLSFPTISGFGPNSAVVHYRVTQQTALPVDDTAPYLVDSGAQYLDGTTDVTRTIHLGRPRAVERSHYTRVLRGHLALRHTRFPRNANGAQLDAIARRPLWDAGLDYGHGTGHGVGCYLNVHERPPGISARSTGGFEPGMVVSNEPGLYLAGEYGIRIENLVCVVEHGEGFLAFDDLTLAPYCRKLIAKDELTTQEIEGVDGYHARVRESLSPRLEPDARAWLERETAPL